MKTQSLRWKVRSAKHSDLVEAERAADRERNAVESEARSDEVNLANT
jgi:plasmid stability protein